MLTEIKNCTIVNAQGASEHGFNIEGDIAFIFELTPRCLGCLGLSSAHEEASHWQFDTVDEDLDAFQFTRTDLAAAIQYAERISVVTQAAWKELGPSIKLGHLFESLGLGWSD